MIELTDEQISEVAAAVERGKEAYIHREHGRVMIADDPDKNVRADPEVYRIVMDTVNNEPEKYVYVCRMPTDTSFAIMQAYVDQVRNQELWQKLSYALKRPRPFKTFRSELESYPKTEAKWLAFRQKRYEKYVKEVVASGGSAIMEEDYEEDED